MNHLFKGSPDNYGALNPKLRITGRNNRTMSASNASNGDNRRRNNYVNRRAQVKKPAAKSGNSGAQDRSPRDAHLSREERGQNLQYRNVNMQNYKTMIDAARDNFADIVAGKGDTAECTICCKASDLFGIGSCRHPVCVECAIRIRVLSNNRQCPVCRTNMETLCFIFVSSNLDEHSLSLPSLNHADEDRYGLRFENGDAITRYEKYLAHVCKLCKSHDGERLEFPTFVSLRHHMSSVHQLTYCHICTENIIQFSRERKTYTRDGLQRHIRAGDRDDKSLKGHPSCLFCEQRFFDEEFRYKHLRKEHFFCQFCETEGKHMNVFFKNHAELLAHYKDQHFLCEFEECRAMGIAFSNQLDLNLHKSKDHSNRRVGLGLDFQFSDRQLAGPSRIRREPPAAVPVARTDKIAVVPREEPVAPKRTDEFVVVPSAQSTTRSRAVRYNIAPAYTPLNEDFPSLGPSLPSSRSDPALTTLRPENFPRLNRVNHPGAKQAQQNGVVPSGSRQQPNPLQSQDPPRPVEDFPALPVATKQLPSTSAWSKKKGSKSVIVDCKVPSNAKRLPQPDLWPERPATTQTREPEPAQWQEVPQKAKKQDKKKQVKQKTSKISDHPGAEDLGSSSEDQLHLASAENHDVQHLADSSRTNREESLPKQKLVGVLRKSKKSAAETEVQHPVRKEDKNSSKEKSQASDESEQTPRAQKSENADLSEVERFIEESAEKDDASKESSKERGTETAAESSSILDWFSLPSKSSLFSNLSLSNVLGPKEEESALKKTQSEPKASVTIPPPPSNAVKEQRPVERNLIEDAPPGLITPPQSDILCGPPPGFEGICPDPCPPPGLPVAPAPRAVFSMAPFLSDSDLRTETAPAIVAQKSDSEWRTVSSK